MSYTVWSRGRLLGHSALEFIYREDGHRCGNFFPADGAQALIDTATEPTHAVFAVPRDGSDTTTAYADLAAACDRQEALELELRDAEGRLIACEDIAIRDVGFLVQHANDNEDAIDAWYESLDPEKRAEIDAAVEHDREIIESWFADDPPVPWKPEPEYPRYQLQIQLVDHGAIP